MGLAAISAALQHDEYNLLILMYDNESYANTDIQPSKFCPSLNSMENLLPMGSQGPWR